MLGFAGPSWTCCEDAVKNVSSNFWAKSLHTVYCRPMQITRQYRSFVLCQDSGCDGRLLDSWDQPEASAAQDLPKRKGWELVARSHGVDDGGLRGMIVGI